MITVSQLVWDAWNIDHIARHDVTHSEVEDVCRRSPIVLESYADRLLLIGSTAAQRLLAVVLQPLEPGAYYVITARSASRTERQFYRRRKGLTL